MGVLSNLFLTAIIIVLAIPGLIIEPGPISEIIAVSFIASIWGIDWNGGGQS